MGWLVLRESASTSDQSVAPVAPSARPVTTLFTPDEEVSRETPTKQVTESTTTNAAAIYQQAFALFDALSKEEKDLIRGGATNVDASVAAELCGKIQPICDLMHQAAAVSNCDWGLEQPVTVHTPFLHLTPCRNIARAAVWSVSHCRTNDPSAAVDDLIATSRLGQNVSSPTLIGYLTDLVLQGLVIESVAGHASMLASTGDTRLMELLSDAKYDDELRRAIHQTADMDVRAADELAAMPPGEAMRALVTVDDRISASQIQLLGTAQAIADFRQAAELQNEYAEALDMPEAEYHAWLISWDEAGNANPFVGVLLTPLENVVSHTQYATVNSAMAAAGLAIMQDGPDALSSNPDPSTGQPFTYTETDDGFTLESTFQLNGKSLKLSFK